MSNLMTTPEGRAALQRAACWLSARRLSRPFKRNFYRAFLDWLASGKTTFSLGTLMDGLNVLNDQERLDLLELTAFLGCTDNITVSDRNIWVDSVTGSDVTGDGSQAAPYATLSFIESLPSVINHQVRVILTSDLTTDNISLNLTFGPNGSFSLIGGVAPVHVVGPLSVTNYSGAGSWVNIYETNGVFSDDQYWGDFISFPAGMNPDECAPIHMMRDTNKIVAYGNSLGAPPFNFVIIRPAVTLSVPSLVINARGSNIRYPSGHSARVFIGNINIDVQTALPGYGAPIQFLGDCAFVGSFLKIITKSNIGGLEIQTLGGYNNENLAYDQSIDTYALTGIPNLVSNPTGNPLAGTVIISTDGASGVDYKVWLTGNAKQIRNVDTRGVLITKNENDIYQIVAAQMRQEGILIAEHVYLDGHPNDPSFRHIGTFSHLKQVFFAGIFVALGQATHCVLIENGGSLILEGCDATVPTPYTGYGINIDGLVSVQTRSDPAVITGTSGDVLFKILGVNTAYPVLDAGITDGAGSWFVWL